MASLFCTSHAISMRLACKVRSCMHIWWMCAQISQEYVVNFKWRKCKRIGKYSSRVTTLAAAASVAVVIKYATGWNVLCLNNKHEFKSLYSQSFSLSLPSGLSHSFMVLNLRKMNTSYLPHFWGDADGIIRLEYIDKRIVLDLFSTHSFLISGRRERERSHFEEYIPHYCIHTDTFDFKIQKWVHKIYRFGIERVNEWMSLKCAFRALSKHLIWIFTKIDFLSIFRMWFR